MPIRYAQSIPKKSIAKCVWVNQTLLQSFKEVHVLQDSYSCFKNYPWPTPRPSARQSHFTSLVITAQVYSVQAQNGSACHTCKVYRCFNVSWRCFTCSLPQKPSEMLCTALGHNREEDQKKQKKNPNKNPPQYSQIRAVYPTGPFSSENLMPRQNLLF